METRPMNDLKKETERLLALADAATPGPWECRTGLYGASIKSEAVSIAHCRVRKQRGQTGEPRSLFRAAYDGALIASAHDMAAQLRALQAENDRLTAENEISNDALRVHSAGAEYAHRLAVMLECALLNRDGTWDDGHALLAEYRHAVRFENEHPTFMGEPALAMSRERG